MFAFGDALGIQYGVGEDGYLALYDLADLRQKAVVSCPKDTYASDVFSNGTDEVILYDKGNKELIRYGALLDQETVMPIEKGTPDSYLMSKDLTGFFYINAEDGQIYEYDLRSGGRVRGVSGVFRRRKRYNVARICGRTGVSGGVGI